MALIYSCHLFFISYFRYVQLNSDISVFKNKRILIVGDIMLDEFIDTFSCRNSPEYKDIPVLAIKKKKQYLGGAANVALNIKKLQAIPYLVGIIGDDTEGKVICNLLQNEDISNLYIHTNTQQKTIKKSRIFQDKKPIIRIDEEEKWENEQLINHFILKNISTAIANHKPHAIILQDYNKGVLNAAIIPEILLLAKQHNLLIGVDPKLENWALYQNVDLFKPNWQELKIINKTLQVTNNSLEDISKALSEKINFKNLLVTLGEKGNFIFDGKTATTFPIQFPIQHADVCGAGDTVIAVAMLGLAAGFSLAEIAKLSNNAGYIVCQKEHIQPILFDELLAFKSQHQNNL